MVGHDKSYRVDIAFGFETTTDDSEGEPTVSGVAPTSLLDELCTKDYLARIIGEHDQVPPQYSAVKINGKKAYEVARKGGESELASRRIEIYDAHLVDCFTDKESGLIKWSVDFSVSKGTYIRALARDIGRELGCPAHVSALRRLHVGSISLADCVSLETLEQRGVGVALDPVAVLGFRFAFCDSLEKLVLTGAKLQAADITLNEPLAFGVSDEISTCTSVVIPSATVPFDGELISVILQNKLKALYRYVASEEVWKPACVFSTAITRFEM